MLQSGHGRKTDGIDAHSVAIVAQHRGDLAAVSADDHSGVLRLLSDRRDELTGERRRALNRLHRLLRELRPGGAPLRLSADRAAQLLATIKPSGAVDSERKAMARQLIADVRRIDRALIDKPPPLRPSGGRLSDHPHRRVRQQQRPRRQDPRAHRRHRPLRQRRPLRQLHPTAPIEVSSGEQTRHRLSRAGNRSLNHALHIAARVQTMHPGPGRTHYQRKRAEQKTSAEALRSLKRQLAKIVYRHLHNDHTRQAANTPSLT